MRKTYPEAYFNFIDVTANEDSTVSSESATDFSDTFLFHEDTRQSPYATLELNQFVLDGSMEILPYNPTDVPFWSEEMSGDDCLYENNPVLQVVFQKNHSSIGLHLYFSGDIPAEILVTWYTLYGTKLIAKTFYPDNSEYFCKCQVENYGKITIEFVKSSLPYRYARMNHVEYGKMLLFGRDKIKKTSVYEEMDPTSATLSINTANIEIIDVDGEFDISNQSGLWKSLQKEQRIDITEYVNGNPVDCGTFYLDTWDSQKNLIKFSLTDILGVMDRTLFYGGKIYVEEYAGVIIASIMESAGVQKYSVAEEVYYTKLSGWIAIQSHRAALQQVVFACGAVADCSRSDLIKIYRPERYVSHTIGTDRKFLGTKVSLDEYVSSVTVSYNSYVLHGESEEITNGFLPAGKSRVEFGAPYQPESITVNTGSIVEAATNYVVVQMSAEGECIITGKKYEAFENACTASVQTIESGETPNTKAYHGCTLLDAGKAREIAEYLLDYHQLRQTAEIRYINDGEAVGNWCNIAMKGGSNATSCILNQTLDLTGGNVATMKSRGYSKAVTDYLFAGSELYAGEEVVI